jgi:hypothetical protein
MSETHTCAFCGDEIEELDTILPATWYSTMDTLDTHSAAFCPDADDDLHEPLRESLCAHCGIEIAENFEDGESIWTNDLVNHNAINGAYCPDSNNHQHDPDWDWLREQEEMKDLQDEVEFRRDYLGDREVRLFCRTCKREIELHPGGRDWVLKDHSAASWSFCIDARDEAHHPDDSWIGESGQRVHDWLE